MDKLKETKERTWYLVKEWTTKVGLKARIHQTVWSSFVKDTAPSLHDFYCGYVQIPKGEKPDEEKLEVHGGVTFSWDKLLELEGEWIGFDMAHFGDENLQDLDYVTEECEKLAAQLIT